MKLFSCYIVAIVLALISCGTGSSNALVAYAPGLYVRAIQTEYAIGNDTLEIQLLDASVGLYTVTRKTVYDLYRKGAIVAHEVETHRHTCALDVEKARLVDTHKGKEFALVPDKHLVLLGSLAYAKVNNK